MAPAGLKARFQANMAALTTLRTLNDEHRPATAAEQRVLARWGSWGAAGLWHVFDPDKTDWSTEREQLRQALTEQEFEQARRTMLNAHFTDPSLVQPIWNALVGMGFDGGRVLEPGCGSGTFIGLAPPSADMVGVELDPVTAGVAAALYPRATIRAESFAATTFPAGHFDAAIGNVPFSEVTLHDARYNAAGLSMHNHFIVKSLAMTRPGGMVAMITSRFTMDAQNPAARRAIAENADLVAAIRLPNGVHRRAAGTEAGSDLLILRRRADRDGPGRPFDATEVVEVPTADGRTEGCRLNTYWAAHPDHVLGTPLLEVGMYGSFGLTVRPRSEAQADERLEATLQAVATAAVEDGLGFAPRTVEDQQRAAGYAPAMRGDIDGMLIRDNQMRFFMVEDGQRKPFRLPRGASPAEMSALLALRDQTRALIAAEAANLDDTAELDRMRTRLAMTWRSYLKAYGPINRYTLRRTGRTNPDTGEDVYARITPASIRLLLGDPYGALVLALEVFDGDRQTADPAGILTSRQIVPRHPIAGVDTAADGLAVVLDTHGRVDVDEIARLMGVPPAAAIAELGDQVFQVPGADDWKTRAEYLSGDVRTKLEVAQAAALAEPGRWDTHVAALTEVLPRDIPAGDIATGLGAIWIPDADYSAFLGELLDTHHASVRRLFGSTWEVTCNDYGAKATALWGTQRMPAGRILGHLLGQEPIEVHDTYPDNRRVLNAQETTAAIEKGHQIQERFNEWVWADPERTARLVAEYNRIFNSLVLRDYTFEGNLLTFPGLTKSFTPREHQRAAIARMIHEPSVGLFHSVGAGKTAEMVIGITELKRLGLIQKAAVVVPNHMLNQFAADWLQLYPQAKVLAASAENLTEDNRRRFIAKIATNDWDAVIMTRTAFQRIPLSPDNEQAFESRQVADIRDRIERLREAGSDSAPLKRLERKMLAREERVKKQRDVPHDPGLCWEHTGFDYIGVDEMHDFKNLQTLSSVRDTNIDGSKRALDLFAKVDYHRNTRGQDRVMVGATATPIANSIAEMYVMQRYLDPAGLERVGIADIDTWIATFAETVSAPELSVAGGERLVWKSRIAKFNNVPELLTMFHSFADIKTPADLNLPVPLIARRPGDGERLPNTVVVPKSPELAAYTSALGERADKVARRQVEPEDDNMLKIGVDGRMAALDLRLVDPAALVTGPTKVSMAADLLEHVWQQSKDYRYLDPAGQPSPHPGALQIVFCDLSTPNGGWNIYQTLKDSLIERGLPADRIRFIHEARNDAEKAQLLQACRNGHVSVLIGSTAKMGTGVNIQHRAIHLMHLDAPWRPADLTQRDGRGVRQLNQHDQVMVTTVVTDGSFDAFMWSALERKARFIDQVMSGPGVDRTVEDVDAATLNYAEIKASISGNPLLIEHAEAEREVRRFTRLAESHKQSEWSLGSTIRTGHAELAQIAEHLPLLRAAVAATLPTQGDAFTITIPTVAFGSPLPVDRTYSDRTSAVPALDQALRHQPDGVVARLGGHDVHARLVPGREWGSRGYQFTLPDAPGVVANSDWLGRTSPNADLGTIVRLEHLVASIPHRITTLQLRQAQVERAVVQATEVQGRPFPHQKALAAARERLDEVAGLLTATRNQAPVDVGPEHEQAIEAVLATSPPVINQRPEVPGPPATVSGGGREETARREHARTHTTRPPAALAIR
ncbi:MAG TPA: helicase-related protein [Ornithinibacter sp.]|nr:helicase-related protein [Ornithinibacter sp.]